MRRTGPAWAVAVLPSIVSCGSADDSAFEHAGRGGPGASVAGGGGRPLGGGSSSGGASGGPMDGSGGGAPVGAGAMPSGGSAASDGGAAVAAGSPPAVARVDPGTEPWQRVPPEQVPEACRLDPQLLAAAEAQFPFPWLIVRYGRLCWESPASATMLPAEAWSTTKTLGAVTTGAVAYQTRDLPETGPKTGPLSDEDPVLRWVDLVSYNSEARIAHVLAMVAHNPSLAFGQKAMTYDIVGTTQINTLSPMLNAAVAQDPARLGGDLEEFAQRFVFGPLGMRDSVWSGGGVDKTFAFTWETTARDMARVGLLVLNGGVWSGSRILDAEWVYRMTHPAFEDANTGYGYLTWLNASSNHHYGEIPGAPVGLQQAPQSPGPCAPVSVHARYPHGLSEAADCYYAAPYTCDQAYDVGVWQAVGLGGQVVQGHPGLDLLLVARDVTPLGSGPDAPRLLWDALRPAVVAADPTFAGDEAGFCAAYGANAYAPDLR